MDEIKFTCLDSAPPSLRRSEQCYRLKVQDEGGDYRTLFTGDSVQECKDGVAFAKSAPGTDADIDSHSEFFIFREPYAVAAGCADQ